MRNWMRGDAVSQIYDRTSGNLIWADLSEPASNFYKASWWEPADYDNDIIPWVRKKVTLEPDPISPPDPTALKALLLEEK